VATGWAGWSIVCRNKKRSRRSPPSRLLTDVIAMLLLAIAFASVIAIIGVLDRPINGFTVPQQPLIDLLSSMEAISSRDKVRTQNEE